MPCRVGEGGGGKGAERRGQAGHGGVGGEGQAGGHVLRGPCWERATCGPRRLQASGRAITKKTNRLL